MHADPSVEQVPGLASMRLLRGLWRMGWSNDLLARRYGDVSPRELDAVLDGQEYLPEPTAARVAAIWTELNGIPGPSWRTIAQADKLGWPPAYELTLSLAGLADHPLLELHPRMDATSATDPSASRTGGDRGYPGAVRLRGRIAGRPDRGRYAALDASREGRG